MASPPLPVVTAYEANSPPGLFGVKLQARSVLVIVGKRPRVLDLASEPALIGTELDFAFFYKEGALVISPTKRKHRRPMGSKKKPVEGTGLRKLAPSGKRRVPKPLSAARKFQL